MRLLALFLVFAGIAQAETITLHSAGNYRFRTAPNLGAPVMQIIRPKEQFEMLARDGDWYLVRYRGRTGYVHKTGITHPLIHRLPNRAEIRELSTNLKAEIAACANSDAARSIDPELVGFVQQVERRLSNPTPVSAASAQGFIWPLAGRISSHFGYRTHPITGTRTLHRGMDIAARDGAPVVAAKAGRVVVSAGGCQPARHKRDWERLNCNGGAGNMVTIDHGDGTQTRYMHLSPGCRLPASGSRIGLGEGLGCVGSTGRATGPHLHFEVIRDGRWLNPHQCLPER